MRKTHRMVFSLNTKVINILKSLVKELDLNSLAEGVRESITFFYTIICLNKEGFTEIIVKNPETRETKNVIFPILYKNDKNE